MCTNTNIACDQLTCGRKSSSDGCELATVTCAQASVFVSAKRSLCTGETSEGASAQLREGPVVPVTHTCRPFLCHMK